MIRFLINQVSFFRLLFLVGLILVVNLLELIGLALFVPIIDLVQRVEEDAVNNYSLLSNILEIVGVSLSLQPLLAIVSFVFIIKATFSLILRYISAKASSDIQINLRNDLFTKYLQSTVSFVQDQRVGSLISVLNDHIARLSQSFFILIQIIANSITVLVYAGFALFISWQMTFFVCVLVLILLPLTGKIGKMTHSHADCELQTLEIAQHFALETLQAKKNVNAMNWQPEMHSRYYRIVKSLGLHWLWVTFLSNSLGIIFQSLSVIILCLLIWLSSLFQLSIASIAVFLLSCLRLLPTAQSVVGQFMELKTRIPSIERVLAMMEVASQCEERSGILEPPENYNIELRDVCFSYNDKEPLFASINLVIDSFSYVALVGKSGSGKTTIADIILGLQQPHSGSVYIGGVGLGQLDIKKFRSNCAYVSQDSILINDTIRNNLLIGVSRTVRDSELESTCKAVGAWEFIVQKPDKLDALIGDRGVQLSGGQRQRLALARCLLRKPKLLILDEATSALDSASEEYMQRAVEKIRLTRSVTVIVIAHRLSTIRGADLIIEVKNGVLESLGTWEQAKGYLTAESKSLEIS